MDINWKATWASKVAGICAMVAGILGIAGTIPLIVKGVVVSAVGKSVSYLIPYLTSLLPEKLPSYGPTIIDISGIAGRALEIAGTAAIAIGVILVSFGIVAVIGGISAVNGKGWPPALAGSILAIFGSVPLGIVSLILIFLGKNQFQKRIKTT